MGFISKLKFLVKAAKPVGAFVDQIKGAKMKYKTIPFWTTILLSAASVVTALNGIIPASVAVIVTAGLTAGYNLLRGIDKMNQEGIKPTWKATEFWVGLGGILTAAIMEIQTAGVNSSVLTSALGVIATFMAVAQNLGAAQPKDVK